MRMVGRPPASRKPAPHHLLFGVNDQALTHADAQPAAQALGLDRYAIPVQWHPGLQLTGHELGDMPRSQKAYVYLYGNAKDAPQNYAQQKEYARYARGLVRQNPNIRELQVWNEPTYSMFWKNGQLNRYMQLLAMTHDALHGSGVSVAAPGSHPNITKQLAFVNAAKRYYRGSGRKQPLFDIYADHPYYDLNKTPVVERAMNRAFRGTAQRSPNRGLKFWLTETGYSAPNTADPSAYYGKSDSIDGPLKNQVSALNYYLNYAKKDPTIGALFNFLLYDERDLGRWQSGLIDPNGQQKPIYGALQQAILQSRRRR